MQIISRADAKAQNLKRYFTGEPCKRGHIAERITAKSYCVECKNIVMREQRKCPTRKLKESERRSTSEHKERKNLNKRINDHYRIIQREIDKRTNKIRAGVKYISKVEALTFGFPRYFEGLICKRGHASERITANGMCHQCAIEMAATPDRQKTKSKYHRDNKTHFSKLNVIRQRERYAKCPEYKASVACRNMLKRVLRKAKTTKNGGSYEILGYDRDELMSHLESLFVDGMEWGNYGEWHIDHIIPVSWWFKNDVNDPSIINALTNLQPLWKQDNLDKRDKLICL
jgi:hypothetical protein